MELRFLKIYLEQSLTGGGARGLTGDGVEELLNYTADKPYILQNVEANMIEPKYDRPMGIYCIFGPLPKTGKGLKYDKEEVNALFRNLNEKAQKDERYAMRYDIWFETRDGAKGS